MNKQRRADLAKADKLIQEAYAIIETARDDEQEAFDNMPEGLQNGDRGEAATAAIDELESAISGLDDVIGNIAQAME